MQAHIGVQTPPKGKMHNPFSRAELPAGINFLTSYVGISEPHIDTQPQVLVFAESLKFWLGMDVGLAMSYTAWKMCLSVVCIYLVLGALPLNPTGGFLSRDGLANFQT